MEVGSLHYDLDIDDKKLRSQLGRADKSVKSFGDRMKKHWDTSVASSQRFGMGLLAVGAAATAFGVRSFKAFKEAEGIMAQTNAVLKSTGNVAGVTAGEISKMARALEFSSLFTGEQVQTGQNLLLTFTKIGKDVFPEATRVMVDMSQALGQDMKSSAIQLGKALNDPIRGVTALRRVGVSFTSQQEEQIKKMVESGETLKAQKFILKELNVEFGGSAKAASDAAGPLEKLKDIFGEAEEVIGGLINRALTPLVNKIAEWAAKIDEAKIQEFVDRVLVWLKTNGDTLAGVIGGALAPAVLALALSFGKLAFSLAPFMILGALIANFDEIKARFMALNPWVQGAATLFGLLATAIAVRFVGALVAASAKTLAFASRSGAMGALRVALMSLSGPGGLFMLVGAAGVAAAVMIINKWNQTKDVLKRTAAAVSANLDSALKQLQRLDKSAANYKQKFDIIMRDINYQQQLQRESGFRIKDLLPFAQGGMFPGNKPILVGERGPEIIWPTKPGYVQPNHEIGTKGNSTVVNIGTIQDRQDADYILRRIDTNQRLQLRGVAPIQG